LGPELLTEVWEGKDREYAEEVERQARPLCVELQELDSIRRLYASTDELCEEERRSLLRSLVGLAKNLRASMT